MKEINGFSKLDKNAKIDWLVNTYFKGNHEVTRTLKQYWNTDELLQKLHDEFIENTISNFYLPIGIAPNFRINDQMYALPMVVEESSVVAAAANAAKYWMKRGGFRTRIINTEKIGQVHFLFKGNTDKLQDFIDVIDYKFYEATEEITQNMRKRGGGIVHIELRDKTQD